MTLSDISFLTLTRPTHATRTMHMRHGIDNNRVRNDNVLRRKYCNLDRRRRAGPQHAQIARDLEY